MLNLLIKTFLIKKLCIYLPSDNNNIKYKTMDKKHNERGAGRKPIIGGKQIHIVCTPEEQEEIKKLLTEIRKNKTKNT